ncbi:ABC transporter ATP-binding protein [Rhizobium sp. VS19-DR104.2]|uniref:ABC transporter ATP-binding protein n=1 Tax=unclassified Rhizobium TaxID=2613769 RepID=UPI001CC41A86|nr:MULTISPECIES: ABC transporter ATP-binding protein [unclassified Rhizobium]MBZ5762229.1 ABC transporter ATP-binding protein [Rhizobium sp. VS19-DR96]MBZ5768245.1 ABC transporter ATP-binding protein [Rhizobium sp. VS19-DR129.2]MBZ5775883.1 ABC transporter ATP-binding protein [Rhizobium sp. VS19-DRK62.2]MBZ5787096.1 ABC transporter ATP-binding protein [Rhizobium sp. VS19-DR121]MBZ5804170.1 ABC transporter ATP-binding protein [Rhizobium sp. VS19-DR181]
MTPALELDKVNLSFGGVAALSDVSIAFPEGKIIGIIGPNGAGKTSLLNVASGVSIPDSGTVSLRGEDVSRCKPSQIAAKGLRRTFQASQLFPSMTVLENMMVGLHLEGRSGFFQCGLRTPFARAEEKEMRERAMESLRFVGFDHFADRPGNALSFGQQRIVEIARTMIANPKVILLDEPAVGLSVNRVGELDTLLRKIRDERGVTVIMIEHVIRLVMAVSDHIVVMSSGRRIAEGTADEVRANHEVVSAYLGAHQGEYH